MCLISKWRFPKITKEDIICYKVLYQNSRNIYSTPFQYKYVDLNELQVADKCNTFNILNSKIKGKGYVHAFIIYSGINFISDKYKIFKAIISKGTKIHVSCDGTEICAKRMFITNKQIKNEIH